MDTGNEFPVESIHRHLERLRSNGYPADESLRVLELLERYGEGGTAEEAVREIVWNLDELGLNRAVSAHVMRNDPLPPRDQDWVSATHDGLVAIRLSDDGYSIQDSAANGWEVSSPAGLEIHQQYHGHGIYGTDLPSRGVALCRVAVALKIMDGMKQRK